MTRHQGKFIAISAFRTAKQGQSGLGLEAQRAAVGGLAETAATGRSSRRLSRSRAAASHRNRPGLARGLRSGARRYGAKLIMSRSSICLSRDPVFLLSLRDAGIDFTAVDMPNANRMTVGIMALVAEQEREAISQRTGATLAAAKGAWQETRQPAPRDGAFQ